jgi:hypothetical protein
MTSSPYKAYLAVKLWSEDCPPGSPVLVQRPGAAARTPGSTDGEAHIDEDGTAVVAVRIGQETSTVPLRAVSLDWTRVARAHEDHDAADLDVRRPERA